MLVSGGVAASGQLLEMGVATAPRDVLLRSPLHLAAMTGKDGR